jgi:outer membrane lipase/esterase
MTRTSEKLLSVAGFLVFLAGGLPAAHAQSLTIVGPVDIGAGTLPGLRTYQRDMGTSIDRVCPTLNQPENLSLLTPLQRELGQRCTEMVVTARALQGLAPPEAGLGLTAEQTADALGRIAGEEIQTPRIQLTETRSAQVQAIGARLQAIRQGVTGLSMAGIGGYGSTGPQFASLGEVETAQQPEGGIASALSGRIGGFITGGYGFGNVDESSFVSGFDFDTQEVTIGADYRLTTNAVIGLALGYSNFDADYDQGNGQKLESDTWIASLYGSYFVSDQFHLDGTLTYARANYDSTRRINYSTIDRTATGNFDTNLYGASLTGGYDLPLPELPLRGLEVMLVGGVDYLHASVDGFSETGGQELDLSYGDSDVDSLRTQLGLDVGMPISTGFGVIRPAVTGRYVHEFLNDGSDTRVVYVNDPTNLSSFVVSDAPVDRNYFTVGAQVTSQLPNGIAAFASYDTVLGLENVTSHLFQIGLRMEF